MKNIFIPVILSLIVSSCFASQIPDFPFVYVEGQARMEVPPDMATISFKVEEFQENADSALSIMKKHSADLISFFNEQGIDKKDVSSYQISKSAKRERKDYAELNILGYELKQEFEVTLRELSKYEELMKKLLSMNNITGIRASFNSTKRKQFESELIAQATADAKQQANLLAKEFGVRLGSIYALSHEEFANLAGKFGLSYGTSGGLAGGIVTDALASEDLFIIPSTIKLWASVNAIFKLEEKK